MTEAGEFSIDNAAAGEEPHFVPAFIGELDPGRTYDRAGNLIQGGMLVGGTPPPMHSRPPAPAGEFAVDDPRVAVPVYDENGAQIGTSYVGTPHHDKEGNIVSIEGDEQQPPAATDPLSRLAALGGNNGSAPPDSEGAALFPEEPTAPTPPRQPDALDALGQLRDEISDAIQAIGISISELTRRVEQLEEQPAGSPVPGHVVEALTSAIEGVNSRVSSLQTFTERATGATMAQQARRSSIGEIG